MFLPDDPSASGGQYTEGTPGVTVPTVVRADHLNAITNEIANAITGYGIALVKGTSTQLFSAIAAAVATVASIVSNRLVMTKGVTAVATDSNGHGGVFTGIGNGEGVVGQGGNGGAGGGGAFTGGTNAAGVIGTGGTGNGKGGSFQGTGTQVGVEAIGGATADGISASGGSTSGRGGLFEGVAAEGLRANGGTNGSGARCFAAGSGDGLEATAPGSGSGVSAIANGSGPAVKCNASAGTGPALNLVAQSAPSSPQNGDIWYDGTDLKIRLGGVTRTVTVT